VSPTFQAIVVSFLLFSAVFFVAQRIWPSVRGQKTFRRGFLTDVAWWAFTPLITRTVTPVAVGLALVPIGLAWGIAPKELGTLAQGHGPLAAQPLWLQAIQIFVIGDFLGYWQHRWFHGGWRWRFHAIHHSSTELDWLSSVRLHPVNDMLARIIVAIPIVLLGYNVGAVALFTLFTTIYAITLHANLSWTYGPLRYVIASPAFHRWHHTSAEEGRDRNFAGFFPLWDLLFGTFHMPRGRQPDRFGVDDPVPEGLLGQLAWPFRRSRSRPDPLPARRRLGLPLATWRLA
jgi:sterol desaturase/sphingolipid hydroxylase (fatty acid hydroxylase superfamily)